MIRSHENHMALRAGALSVLVHAVLLVLLLISFNWKSTQPMNVAEVELWDRMPAVKPLPPEPKPEPKLEPKPEPKPEPEPEPKAEIQLKKEEPKKPEPKIEKPIEKPKEPPKPDPAIKARELEKKRLEEVQREKEKIKQLQQMLAEEDNTLQQEQQKKNAQAAEHARSAQAAAASSGEVDKYKTLIQAKIHRNVNKQLCGSGKPELVYGIALMPTGELVGAPRLIKSSGITACDEAVERAIKVSQPLPLPPQPELFSQFRDLNLKFRPNDDN